jgi:hypothetical protein
MKKLSTSGILTVPNNITVRFAVWQFFPLASLSVLRPKLLCVLSYYVHVLVQ